MLKKWFVSFLNSLPFPACAVSCSVPPSPSSLHSTPRGGLYLAQCCRNKWLYTHVCACVHTENMHSELQKKKHSLVMNTFILKAESQLYSQWEVQLVQLWLMLLYLLVTALRKMHLYAKPLKYTNQCSRFDFFFSFYQLFSVNQLMKRLQDSHVFAFSCFFCPMDDGSHIPSGPWQFKITFISPIQCWQQKNGPLVHRSHRRVSERGQTSLWLRRFQLKLRPRHCNQTESPCIHLMCLHVSR